MMAEMAHLMWAKHTSAELENYVRTGSFSGGSTDGRVKYNPRIAKRWAEIWNNTKKKPAATLIDPAAVKEAFANGKQG